MFPSEMAILMDIAKNKDSDKQLANRPMDVINEYVCCLCGLLVRRGYIKGNRTKGYQLTSMGRRTLAEFAGRKKARNQKKVKTNSIEYCQELGKLRKERLTPIR